MAAKSLWTVAKKPVGQAFLLVLPALILSWDVELQRGELRFTRRLGLVRGGGRWTIGRRL